MFLRLTTVDKRSFTVVETFLKQMEYVKLVNIKRLGLIICSEKTCNLISVRKFLP